MKFKKGQKVICKLFCAGLTTKEDRIVSRISKTKNHVWLNNGDGNDESGPFDGDTGRQILDASMPAWLGYQEIE